MARQFWIGIDIGKQGAIAIQAIASINELGPGEFLQKMPMIKTELDYQALYNLLSKIKSKNGIVVFEKLGVIFGTSKQTAFSMGHQAGAIEMLCVSLSIPFVKVPPKQWQKDMFVGITEISKPSKSGKTTVRDTKAMALLAVKQLLPCSKLTFGDKATKPDDGLIDALLLREWAKQKYP